MKKGSMLFVTNLVVVKVGAEERALLCRRPA